MLKHNQRITKKKEFDLIFSQGKSSFSSTLGVKSLSNNLTLNRFGVIISNKVSKSAVERNTIRRRLREIFRELDPQLKPGQDLIVIVQKPSLGLTLAELRRNLILILKNKRLLNE